MRTTKAVTGELGLNILYGAQMNPLFETVLPLRNATKIFCRDEMYIVFTQYNLFSFRNHNISCSHSEILTYEPRHGISNNVVYATCKALDQPANTPSLIRAFASRLNIV